MTANTEGAKTPAAKTAARRGPRKESEIRAELEAELREKIFAEMQAEAQPVPAVDAEAIRAQIRAEMENEARVKAQEEARQREMAAEARPINAREVDGDPTAEGALTVHFVEDGLTLLGKVWYRGEELTIVPGTPQWNEAHSILSMDEFDQEARWGKRFIRAGLWRGKRLDEIVDEELTDAEREQLKKAARLRDERYGPVLHR